MDKVATQNLTSLADPWIRQVVKILVEPPHPGSLVKIMLRDIWSISVSSKKAHSTSRLKALTMVPDSLRTILWKWVTHAALEQDMIRQMVQFIFHLRA